MTEAEYDEIIAPKLAEVAKLVSEMGGSLVARVEWEKDEAGITKIGVSEESGVAQQLTLWAALSRGNIDAVCMEALKRFDCSQSIVLSRFQTNGARP